VKWVDGAYYELPDEEADAAITKVVKAEFDRLAVKSTIRTTDEKAGQPNKPTHARMVTKTLLGNVRNALASESLLPGRVAPPAWLDPHPGDPPPDELLPCRNGLVHLPALVAGRQDYLMPPTPRLFVQNRLSYDFCPDAPEPTSWQNFLNQLWPSDPGAIETLREWIGYCLTANTGQQKIALLVGPKRSGKGTIARVLRELVGPENCCGPTLAGLAQQFGLQSLLGKSLGSSPTPD
jgi:putative DNA primase/helicase